MKNVIVGNFGNHSLAVMQALIERKVPGLHFAYVNTGWAAARWAERISACSEYACQHGVEVHELNAQTSFSDLVLDRKQFPSPKFQWCASFLKGLPLIDFLDLFDPGCEAIIISGKRRLDSRRYADLQEFDFNGEFYQGRTIWHPLWLHSNHEFKELIKRTGFDLEIQQSLECYPCVHASPQDLSQLDLEALVRLDALEQRLGKTMYTKSIKKFYIDNKPAAEKKEKKLCLQTLDRGCGAPWGCGE